MRGVRAGWLHLGLISISLSMLCAMGMLELWKRGFFEPSRVSIEPVAVVRPARPQGIVVVDLSGENIPPDESECLDIIEYHGEGRNPDQVVQAFALRKLPEERELTFDEEMAAWRERDEERKRIIEIRNMNRPIREKTFYIPPEPSPEEIRLRKRWEEQNEIAARISEENANKEFELIEKREKERLERSKNVLEETKKRSELARKLKGLERERSE